MSVEGYSDGWMTKQSRIHFRRKFRSQTSDTMERSKSRGGKSQRRGEKKREGQRWERVRSAGARKGRKVVKHCVFPMICGSRGSKSRLAKAAGAEPSGRMRDEKLYAVLARSTLRSLKAKNTSRSEHFWKLRCWKSERCWREAHFGGDLYAVVARTQIKMSPHVRTTFGPSDVVSRGWRKGFSTLSKVSKTRVICSSFKSIGRRGTFQEDLQRCIFRGRCSTRDMFIRDVTRSGRWFPERGCILEHQIFRFAAMIWRDRYSTLYDLASIFRGKRSTLDRWTGKIAKRIGTRPSALHSTVHFEGSLAELFRFWCCQLRKLRKSRRIVSFLMLSSSKKWESLADLLRF